MYLQIIILLNFFKALTVISRIQIYRSYSCLPTILIKRGATVLWLSNKAFCIIHKHTIYSFHLSKSLLNNTKNLVTFQSCFQFSFRLSDCNTSFYLHYSNPFLFMIWIRKWKFLIPIWRSVKFTSFVKDFRFIFHWEISSESDSFLAYKIDLS